MRIVLIGAGSMQFGTTSLGDIMSSTILEGSEIVLVDIDNKALQETLKVAKAYLASHPRPYTVTATTDRKQALQGADVVVISIEVGQRFALWNMDWTLPQQYGIPQVYGENGGAGGTFHALRIIPPILAIADDIDRICPDALVINYSNPMTAICTTVCRKHPDMKFIGLCHEIASLERYLPRILGTPWSNLEVRAAGLNHFSVVVEARYKDTGKDAYPDILEKAPAFFARQAGFPDLLAHARTTGEVFETEGVRENFAATMGDSRAPWEDRHLFHFILEHFHLLPITLDSHFGEYIPWAMEESDLQGIEDFYTYYQLMLSSRRTSPSILPYAQERLRYILEGYATNSGYEEEAVNIPNDGLLDTLPRWISIEVPAHIGRQGAKGIAFPHYDKGMAALLRNYTGAYDLIADAVLEHSKEKVIQSLLVNPVIRNVSRIPELVDLMIDREKPWLDYLQ